MVMNEDEKTSGGLTRRFGWVRSLVLGAALAGVYLANGREIGTYDTEGSSLTALSLSRGEGPFLDRYKAFLVEPGTRGGVAFASDHHGHVFSRYPVATPMLAVPWFWVEMPYLDRAYPGWSGHPGAAWAASKWMGKHAACFWWRWRGWRCITG